MYTTRHYVCILSLYMNNFQRFFSEYKQDFSLMLILYGLNVSYYLYILWCHFANVITATLTLSYFSNYKSDLDHWGSDYNHVKSYLSHYKRDLGHWRSDHSHFENDPNHCKRDLDHWRSDYNHLKSYLSHYKSDLGHWIVITATLKSI